MWSSNRKGGLASCTEVCFKGLGDAAVCLL
jgi:hypothetical protein